MSDQLTFSIRTGLESRPIIGTDTTILHVPKQFWVDIQGRPTLAAQPFLRWLRELATKQAGDLGEALHHAEFVITKDPAAVESMGNLHDCDECRAATRQALRFLRENPTEELLVGQLWWAG